VVSTCRSLAALALAGLVSACSKPPPSFEEVEPADVLYQRGQEILEGGTWFGVIPRVKHDDAIDTFQSIIDNYPYSEYAVLAELRIADAYFDDGKYEEALAYYRDFADLHPQHEMVPYTIYRAALCHERRMRSADRDQTPTRDALLFLDRLLAHYPYSEYAAEAEVLWRSLRTRLAQHVKEIADFYVSRDEWESAAERYRTILNEYPGLGFDAEALYRLGLCYLHMNRETEAESIFQAVVQNYQDSDVARDAEDRIAALH
jgi:outer membrane protein assembly factor BamD